MSEFIEQPVQTLKPRFVCSMCTSLAVMTYSFPGQPPRGLCASHRNSVQFFQEPSPGQCIQATVQELPAEDLDDTRVE